MATHQDRFDELCRHARETALLESIDAVLSWDERTMLPPAGGDYRAEQLAYLAAEVHRRRTAPRLGELLGQLAESPLASDPHSDAGTTIRELRRAYDKNCKRPAELVEELARTAVLGQQTWVEARKHNDYAAFAPLLERIVRLKREEAQAIGYEEHLYDALLDDYEPHETTTTVTAVLEGLRQELVPLVGAIAESSAQSRADILQRRYPVPNQAEFSQLAAREIGFDFARGRLDVTEHPFCSSMGPDDCRLTTRYLESFFPSAFFGTLHEAGHGIYEQGLRTEQHGLPPGETVSLGIHESQSRLWENQVGRSHGFWRHFYTTAQRAFPSALGDVGMDDFYFAVNDVRPSLVRVEADEATYNLHIIIRFQLEQALLNDQLTVTDLPDAWNDIYEETLGVRPSDDTDGVLQDIHWSGTSFGYFPTYSLGNLYAAQFAEAADAELGSLDEQFARGEFEPLLNWLRDRIHRPGQRFTAAELVLSVTGKPLSHEPLMNYLRGKLEPLYRLGTS